MTWCYEDFAWFYERLTLPEGKRAELEGFQRLILRTIFSKNMVSLLVLIPKGHAKTTLMAALAVYHLLITRNANCYIGAADRIQADEMYRFAAHFAECDPEIEGRIKVLRGTREIKSLVDQGFIKVLASDDSKQGGKRQGFNPTLALIDELHAHENDNLYTDMRSGLFKRKGIMVTITTAGWDIEGVLGKLRAGFLEEDDVYTGLVATPEGSVKPDPNGRLTMARKPSGNSVMLEWAIVPETDDPDNMEVVKLANPASWVDLASLYDAKESLTPWTFRRYRCNLWTLNFDSWLPADAWDNLKEAGVGLRPNLPAWAALDMARYHDSAALVVVQPRPDLPAVVQAFVWRPGGPDDPVSYEVVKQGIRDLSDQVPLELVGFDERLFDQAGQELTDEGYPMEVFPQSNERMCPATAELRTAILGGALAHDGDPVLAAHVMGAIAKDVGDSQFKLTKSRRNGPDIDAAEALAMAWALARTEAPEEGAEFW